MWNIAMAMVHRIEKPKSALANLLFYMASCNINSKPTVVMWEKNSKKKLLRRDVTKEQLKIELVQT